MSDLGSSVDSGVEANMEEESVFYRRKPASQRSLSTMSDLEHDAVPSPNSAHFGENSPFDARTDNSSVESPSPRGGNSYTGGGNISQEGASYCPSTNNAEPDDNSGMKKDPCKEFERKPEHEQFDAVIIAHHDDFTEVAELKERLNSTILYDGTPARVALESDNSDLGKTELRYFEDWLEKAEIMFLFATQKFCKDVSCKTKEGISLVDSFFVPWGKKEYVIPIFVDKKYEARYLSPSLRAMTGVDLWSTKRSHEQFKNSLNSARRKRQEQLTSKMSDMTLED